jgi:hypothetical protein
MRSHTPGNADAGIIWTLQWRAQKEKVVEGERELEIACLLALPSSTDAIDRQSSTARTFSHTARLFATQKICTCATEKSGGEILDRKYEYVLLVVSFMRGA